MEPKTKSPARSPGAAAAQAGPSVQPITHTQTDFAPLTIGGVGTQVEAEDVDDSASESDADSLLATECSTETTSVSSSVFEFTYANGRRYHSDRFRSADYFMPNDENEQERLDLYHHQFLQFLGGKLHLAPLDNPQRVLDVGTGTGIWAIDFADEYEGAEVIGTDISPVQSQWVPPNCKFEIDDMEEEWTYIDDYFDYIHMRSLSGAFQDWAKVLKNAYNKTKPGGYLEFQDYGCECFLANGKALDYADPNHPLSVWLHEIVQASNKAGRPLVMGKLMKRLMEEAGFVDVVENTTIWPIGNWPKDKRLKEVGRWGLIGMTDSLYPFALSLLTKWSNWNVKQVEELCDSVKKGLPKQKYYFHGWFVYGRKPEDKKHKH